MNGVSLWLHKKTNFVIPLVIGAVSAVTHLLFFGQPRAVVFDETYFLHFVGNYGAGTYFFDIHPPLGKLIFLFFMELFGITPTSQIGTIGEALPQGLIFVRLIPIIAGLLLPLLIYYLARQLKLSRTVSTLAALLICVENSILVQSRFVLMDSLLILFGFLSLFLYLKYRDKQSTSRITPAVFVVLSAMSYAATMSIKWSGVFFIFPIIIMEIYYAVTSGRSLARKFSQFISTLCIYGFISLVIYMSIFAIHFKLLPKSGPGDAFMSRRFQEQLTGNPFSQNKVSETQGFFGKFFELNAAMYDANQTLDKPHSYSSQFYTWPLMQRGIYYWTGAETTDPKVGQARIYLLGNPLVYWLGTISILTLLFYFAEAFIRRKVSAIPNKKTFVFIIIAYLSNLVPFIFIGRVMFLYHYEAALVVSVLAFAYLVDRIDSYRLRVSVVITVLVVSVLLYLFFAPLTYGLPLTGSAYNLRLWLPSWL